MSSMAMKWRLLDEFFIVIILDFSVAYKELWWLVCERLFSMAML